MHKFIVICLLTISSSASAQSLSVFNIDTTNFPTMEASFYAFDSNGQQVSPSISDITVTEDGIVRTITGITCPPKTTPPPITLGIMVDTYSGIDLAKYGAQKLIDLVSIPPSEAGITMMDHGAFIVQDLTQQSRKLTTAIAKLSSAAGVDLQTMFYAPNAGGVPFVSGRPNKKVLVLITDLHCPLFNLDKKQLYQDAANQNISVFIILLGTSDEYGYSKEITDSTGGKLFEQVNNSEQLNTALSTIVTKIENFAPCNLSWVSASSCDLTRGVIITYQNIGRDSVSYKEPAAAVPELSLSNYGIDFGQIIPGQTKDTTIVITAQNLPITITDISTSDNAFKVMSGTAPPSYTLMPGQSQKLVLRYMPNDSSYKFEKVTITSNACLLNPIYLIGGFASQKDSIARMTLLKPNGGEKFSVGDTEIITWSNTYLDDTVTISYSIDKGKTWQKIIDSASGYSYTWIVPRTPSDSCLVKIREHRKFSLDTVLTLLGHTAFALHVAFSPNGKQVVSTGSDLLAIIWDAQTGKLLHKLIGHTGDVVDAQFSPDGSQVITGSRDNTAKLWDVATGNLLQTFIGHKWEVNTVQFNIDGTRALTSSKDTTAIMWDVQTGIPLTIFKGHAGWLTAAIFSPFGDRVYTSSNDGTVKIWDAATGKELFNLVDQYSTIDAIALSHNGDLISSVSRKNIDMVWNTKDGSIFHSYAPGWGFTQFSSDDQMLLSATDDYAHVWDVRSGIEINSFNGYPYVVLCGTFSPDNRVVATAGISVQCWDVQTGDKLITLLGHTWDVTSLAFNNTFYELASASWDNTVKLWFLHYRPDQYDVSDSVFSIVMPTFSFASNVIDMGQVEQGREKDSIVKATICNSGSVPLHVLGMDVTSGDKAEFMIMSGAGDFTLQPGQCRDVMFTYMPMMMGKMSATVTLRTSTGDYPDTIKILGEGIAPLLSVMGNVIDFGQVKIGNFKDTIISVAIQNIGNLPVNFPPATQLGPDVIQFSLLSSAAGFSLSPGASQSVTLRFSPHYVGRTSGRIAFDYNAPSSPAILSVFGQGLGGLVTIPEDSGYAGDHKNIPMILEKVPVTSIQSLATNYSARIAYDNSVLEPIGGVIQKGNRFDTINVSGLLGTSDTLGLLPFTVLLGERTISPLNIVDFSWLDGAGNPADYDADTKSGTFTVLYGCGDSLLWNFMSTGRIASITSVNPNPSNGIIHIDIQTTESGRTQLQLFNLLGQKVGTISDGELKPGLHTFDFDSHNLNSGSYFLTLTTPTVRRMERVDIAK